MEPAEEKLEDAEKEILISEEIKVGETDERVDHIGAQRNKVSKKYDRRMRNEVKEELCRAKKAAIDARRPKTVKILVYEKPCTLPKRKTAIPREDMSKQQWIDTLATPSRKCAPPGRTVETRILRATPPRINELARPTRQRMLNTLRDRGTTLPAALVDRLIRTLESESSLTPEQAEKLFRKKRRKKKHKLKPTAECQGEDSPAALEPQQSSLNKDAVTCQYAMAESFVKSILQWQPKIPREEFADIAQVILLRLQSLYEYESQVTIDDRAGQQMRFLADIVASWIAGVLMEVAQLKEDELNEECAKKRALEEEEEEEEDDDDDDDDDEDDDTAPDKSKSDNSLDPDDDDDDMDPDNDDNDASDPGDASGSVEGSEKTSVNPAANDRQAKSDETELEEPQQSPENGEATAKPPDEIQDEEMKSIIMDMGTEVDGQMYTQASAITAGNWPSGWPRSKKSVGLFPRQIYLDSIYPSVKGNGVILGGQNLKPRYSIREREINTADIYYKT